MSWKGKSKRAPGSGKMRRNLRAAGMTGPDGRPYVLLVVGTEQAMLNADDWDTTKNHIDGLFRVALLKGGII